MRVGAAQFSGSTDRESNLAAVARLTQRAAQDGVDLLCFHELASTVYVPFAEDPRLFDLAEQEDGPSVTAVRELARQMGLWIVYPFFERDGRTYYNTALTIDAGGAVASKYRKSSIPTRRLLPAVDETYFFAPGDLGFPVVPTPSGVRVGVIICYERNLPEPARCIALNGADVLVVPVTTTPEARPVWEMLLRTRALENGMYVVAPSRVGLDEGGAEDVPYIGESLVISPTGAILGHGSASSEDLVVVDLDPALLRTRRDGWSYVTDRRPEIYDVLAAPGAAAEPIAERVGERD